jgi:hypothetical protein
VERFLIVRWVPNDPDDASTNNTMPHLSRRQFLISASFPAGSAFEANLALGQNKTLSQRNVGFGEVLVDTEDFILINDATWASPPPVFPEARRVKG